MKRDGKKLYDLEPVNTEDIPRPLHHNVWS